MLGVKFATSLIAISFAYNIKSGVCYVGQQQSIFTMFDKRHPDKREGSTALQKNPSRYVRIQKGVVGVATSFLLNYVLQK